MKNVLKNLTLCEISLLKVNLVKLLNTLKL